LKNKPKRSNGPSLSFVRFGKTALHLLRLVSFTLALLVLLALFHLLTLGIPNRATRHITAQARKKGLPLQIESIRLSPHRGWVLHNVRLYSTSPDDLKPLFRAENLYVFIWPDNWFAPSKTGWKVSLYGKNSEVSLGHTWEAALCADSPFRTVDRLHTSLRIHHKQLQLEDSDLRWGGLHIRTRGQADFADQPAERSLPEFQSRAAQLANILGNLQFETEPEINIRFQINADAPEKNSFSVTCFADGLLWKERVYNRLSAMLNLQNGRLTLNSLQIAQPDGEHLTASGSFDPESRMAQLTLENSLHALDLLNLLPDRIHSGLAQAELQPLGAVDLTATLGPAPAEKLLEQIHVDVQNLQVTRKDLTLDPLAFKLTRDGDRLIANEIRGLANGGPLTGTFEMDLPSRAWRTSLQATAQPHPIGTLGSPGLKKWIDRFRFPNDPPKITVNLSYAGTKGTLRMDGTLSGTNFFCSGVPIETLQTSMAYSNRVFTLTPLHAAYEDKQFDGTVHVDFAKKLSHFNATSSFDPLSIARILAPEKHTVVEQFAFNGPIDSEGSGQVDYGTGTNHAFRATLHAEQVSVENIQADVFDSRIEGRGTQLLFTNASFQCSDGFVEGDAEFDLRLRDGTAPYRIDLGATQINLQKLLRQMNTNDHRQTRGTLSGTFRCTADAKAGFWNSAAGLGQINIEKGRLASIPLLKGFARLMPGTKIFSITTFFADYELHGGKLRSENIQLGGTLFSAQARGRYSPTAGFNVRLRAVQADCPDSENDDGS